MYYNVLYCVIPKLLNDVSNVYLMLTSATIFHSFLVFHVTSMFF